MKPEKDPNEIVPCTEFPEGIKRKNAIRDSCPIRKFLHRDDPR
jgi:hypothetical protein